MAPTQAASYIQGFAPQYQAGRTQVNKIYGLPVDPRNAAISAGLGVYNTFRPQDQYQPNPANQAQADLYRAQTAALQGQSGTAAVPSAGTPTTTYQTNPLSAQTLQNPYSPPVSTYQPGQINTQAGFNQGAQMPNLPKVGNAALVGNNAFRMPPGFQGPPRNFA
jgi:hypothetical protein